MIRLAHMLNAGTRIGAKPSALHKAPSATDGFYAGCDVSLTVERQHAVWDDQMHTWGPETTGYQLSVAEAVDLIGQLQRAVKAVGVDEAVAA